MLKQSLAVLCLLLAMPLAAQPPAAADKPAAKPETPPKPAPEEKSACTAPRKAREARVKLRCGSECPPAKVEDVCPDSCAPVTRRC